jgi:hypothetical protein
MFPHKADSTSTPRGAGSSPLRLPLTEVGVAFLDRYPAKPARPDANSRTEAGSGTTAPNGVTPCLSPCPSIPRKRTAKNSQHRSPGGTDSSLSKSAGVRVSRDMPVRLKTNVPVAPDGIPSFGLVPPRKVVPAVKAMSNCPKGLVVTSVVPNRSVSKSNVGELTLRVPDASVTVEIRL